MRVSSWVMEHEEVVARCGAQDPGVYEHLKEDSEKAAFFLKKKKKMFYLVLSST